MPKLETVKVVNESLESGFMIINKADFDESKHELFEGKKAPKQANVKDTVALIEQVETLEQLEQFREDERKGVKDAVEAKEAHLKGGDE